MCHVLVFSTKYATGYPDPPNQTETSLVTLAEALTVSYETDAHFVAYTNPINRRVRVEAIGTVPIVVNLLIGDVDDPVAHAEKTAARAEWREVEHAKIAKLFEKHPGAYVYETNGGYRVIFQRAPFEIHTADDKKKWWTVYLDFRTYMAREFAIEIDPNCKDFTRFFRLPNVVRKGKRENHWSCGDATNIEALNIAPSEERKKPPKYVKKALESASAEVRAAPPGTRNEALNRAAYSLGGFIPTHIDRATVFDTLLFAILSNGGDQDGDAAKIDAAIDAGMAAPREIPHTNGVTNGAADHGAAFLDPKSADDDGITASFSDVSNAEKLVDRHLDDLRYVATWGKWIFWDGKRWSIDSGESALRFAVLTARAMMKEARESMEEATKFASDAAASGDEEAVARSKNRMKWAMKAIDWAQKSHSRPRLEAMLAVSCADPRIAIRHERLDVDPWLLNVDNGTIDLRAGVLRSHLREDLITKITPVPYDVSATAPTWLAFLSAVMAGDKDLVSYLARVIGYSLTGEIRDHVLVFFHGETGSNGKSTFLQTIHKMLGEYAMPAARNLLFGGASNRHPTERATLHGKRFVTCSEIEEGQAFNEGLLKDLTGGDPINARRMREDEWSFPPTHKLFIAGNHKPRVKGTDGGIWRRIHLVPWLVCFETTKDLTLPAKLEAELPGILAWAVQSCLDWQRVGLAPPGGVRDATQGYRDESNPLGEFVSLRCRLEPDAKVSRRALREAYDRHCRENGEKFPLGPRPFAAKLRALGATDTTMSETTALSGTHVVNAWRGIRLLSENELGDRCLPTRDQAVTN